MVRRCIFCGGKPVTKEHIYGAWLTPLFPRPSGKRMYEDMTSPIGSVRIKHPRRYPLSLDHQVKQVCKSCNGGWMSSLETSVGDIIPTIHRGTKHSITPEEQTLLASWASKTAVAIQYMDSNPIVPKYRRKWMFDYHTPPPDTSVWIARYDGASIAGGQTVDLFFHMKMKPKPLSFPHGQAVCFSVGSLVFAVLSIYIKNVAVRPQFPVNLAKHLFPIWPQRIQNLSWPRTGLDNTLRTALYYIDWGKVLHFYPLSPLPQPPEESSTGKE